MEPTIQSLTPEGLVARVRATVGEPRRSSGSDLDEDPLGPNAPKFSLIVGAGFSAGVVPLVDELLCESIGDYYTRDPVQSAAPRPRSVLRENSAGFWGDLNRAAEKARLEPVPLDRAGLPKNLGGAYETLFSQRVVDRLFEEDRLPTPSHGERMPSRPFLRAPLATRHGGRFLKGFLRYALDPAGEHGRGSAGRATLNPAHIYLAALLEAQQLGICAPFCRTILTTNFDTLLQNALQMVNLAYTLDDRPERSVAFDDDESAIHLVYLHGSVVRHAPAGARAETGILAPANAQRLRAAFRRRDVIAIGYSGWEDGLMAALAGLSPEPRIVYWCDVSERPPAPVADLLARRGDSGVYVDLGVGGADALMQQLYRALVPYDFTMEPMDRYRWWNALRWRAPSSPASGRPPDDS